MSARFPHATEDGLKEVHKKYDLIEENCYYEYTEVQFSFHFVVLCGLHFQCVRSERSRV